MDEEVIYICESSHAKGLVLFSLLEAEPELVEASAFAFLDSLKYQKLLCWRGASHVMCSRAYF